MTDKTPPHIKLDEHNHIEKFLLSHLDRQGRAIISLMQDLLTGKKRVTALLDTSGAICNIPRNELINTHFNHR